MTILLFKLLVTPLLIGAASLAGRRWGPSVGGWIVGLPLTSGPVAAFLAVEKGVDFAAAAAVGILAGTTSQAIFALGYARDPGRHGWPLRLAAGVAAFALATLAFDHIAFSVGGAALLATAALLLGLRLLGGDEERPEDAAAVVVPQVPRWDIPARMAVATAVVVSLTGLASRLGPQLTGLLSPFPVYAAVLAVFAHRRRGPAAATATLRGLLVGLFSFVAFFTVLATTLPRIGGAAFGVAVPVAALVQASSFGAARVALRSSASAR